jgi:hypothetical protein
MKIYTQKKEKSNKIEIGLTDGEHRLPVGTIIAVSKGKQIKELEIKFNHQLNSVDSNFWRSASLKTYRLRESMSNDLVGKHEAEFLLTTISDEESL